MNVFEILNVSLPDEPESKAADFWIQAAASLMGFLGAWFLFWLGNKYSKQKGDVEKDQFEKDKLLYCHSLISGSEVFSASLIEHLDEFVAEIRRDSSMIPRLNMSAHNRLFRFVQVINHEDHFHAYQNQLDDAATILKIFDYLDFIENLRVNVYKQFKQASQFNGRDRRLFTSRLDKGFKLFLSHFPLVQPVNDLERKLFAVFQSGMTTYREIYKSGDLSAILDQFLDPVTKELVEFQLACPDRTFDQILSLFSSASSILNHTKRNNLHIADSLEDDCSNLKEVHRKLLESSEPLSSFIDDVNRRRKSKSKEEQIVL